MYSKYIHKTHIYIYHIVCKQYICKQIINLYVFIVYDEFCIYVYNYKKEMNISIEGQILSIRKISKKLSFCDFMLFHNNNNVFSFVVLCSPTWLADPGHYRNPRICSISVQNETMLNL